MTDLNNYFSQSDKILSLESKIKVLKVKLADQVSMTCNARRARDKINQGNVRAVNILIELVNTKQVDLTREEIAGLCFVSEGTVKNAQSIIKRGKKL